jgi:hypothetical protein
VFGYGVALPYIFTVAPHLMRGLAISTPRQESIRPKDRAIQDYQPQSTQTSIHVSIS